MEKIKMKQYLSAVEKYREYFEETKDGKKIFSLITIKMLLGLADSLRCELDFLRKNTSLG
jgi:hypothetical protein